MTSSHFASAEKQFRFPLEYANQRPKSATWTVTGSAAFVLGKERGMAKITGITTGKIVDFAEGKRMAFHKVMISGIHTSELTVLKEEEKMALLREIQETGSKAARDKLIQGNLRLVLSVIQRFTGRGEDMEDLFQVGVVGLIKATGGSL